VHRSSFCNINCRPGRPSEQYQGDDILQSAEGATGDPLQQNTLRVLTSFTPAHPKAHTKKRQELGNALGNQKAKQKRRKIAEVETSRGDEQQIMTKTFSGTVERLSGGEQRKSGKTFGGNIGLPSDAAERIQQSIHAMNPYEYGLGQLPGTIGHSALTYSHT